MTGEILQSPPAPDESGFPVDDGIKLWFEGDEGLGVTVVFRYRHMGPAFVKDISGRFVLALHDRKNRGWLLARDSAGSLPLYYLNIPDGVRFSTRIGPLLKFLPRVELHPPALIDYLTHLWALDGKTFFPGIRLLPAGAMLTNSGEQHFFQYQRRPEHRSIESWADEIVEALGNSVSRAVAPGLACHLSGGIDSSAVTVFAARAAGEPPICLASSFPDFSDQQEIEHGRIVADSIGATLNEVPVRSVDACRVLRLLLLALEEPKCHPPVLARYLLEAAASERGSRRVLTGRGADELFTGYDSHAAGQLPDHRRRRTVPDLLDLLRPEFVAAAGYEAEHAYYEAFETCQGDTLLDRVLAFDSRTLLANWMVIDAKISRSFGLECVAPFLDKPMIDLALRIPDECLLAGNQLKGLLKRAFRGILPDTVVDRPKIGFRTPFGEMLRLGAEPFTRDALAPGQSIFWDWFDRSSVAQVVDAHFSGARNFGWQLWALLCVREWTRIYLEEGKGRE